MNSSFRSSLADSRVPPELHLQLLAWVESGLRPSRFLQGIITNNLRLAIQLADDPAGADLGTICMFLLVYAPSGAFFDEKALENWPMYLAASERQKGL